MKFKYYLRFDVDNPSLHVLPNGAIFSFMYNGRHKRNQQLEKFKAFSGPLGEMLSRFGIESQISSSMVRINLVAAEIIEKMYEPNTFPDIVKFFVNKYNDSPENVEKNIVAFFEEFENKLGIKITECESVNEIKKYNFRLTGSKEYFVPSDLTLELTYRCAIITVKLVHNMK
ncbi:PqqD family protein [Caldisericum sp.]|uniref:PqqD family protein n=1 Tax=Caldisericum sp. TaxID=2499687 RepID=UPI003D116667